MDFEADLTRIFLSQFDELGISYDPALEFGELVVCYLEMVNRRISGVPRQVRFSDEIHASLGRLSDTGPDTPQDREKKKEAWRAVFLLRERFETGKNVNGFLSKRIAYATGPQSKLLGCEGPGIGYRRRGIDHRAGWVRRISVPIDFAPPEVL